MTAGTHIRWDSKDKVIRKLAGLVKEKEKEKRKVQIDYRKREDRKTRISMFNAHTTIIVLKVPILGARELNEQLKVYTALSEEISLVPKTCIKLYTAIFKSISRKSELL